MKRLARLLAYLALMAVLGPSDGLAFHARPSGCQPATTPPLTGQVDRIVIEKSARRMQLIQDGQAVRTYKIALGFTPEGDKDRQGDGKHPGR